MKVVTYDVGSMLIDLQDLGHKEVSLETVVAKVEDYAREDFSCGWGHTANISDLIWTNEDGVEL
jgi:hypothetical protein